MAAALAAAAIPLVISLFQKRPKTPGFEGSSLPNREAEKDELLRLASDPSSDVFRLASGTALDNVNRALAQRGLSNSSLGLQTIQSSQAGLAQDFLQQELDRRAKALQTVSGVDFQGGQIESANQQNRFNAANTAFQDQLTQQQQLISGVGGFARSAAGSIESAALAEQRNKQFEALLEALKQRGE